MILVEEGLYMHRSVVQKELNLFDLFLKALLHVFCLDFLVKMI